MINKHLLYHRKEHTVKQHQTTSDENPTTNGLFSTLFPYAHKKITDTT